MNIKKIFAYTMLLSIIGTQGVFANDKESLLSRISESYEGIKKIRNEFKNIPDTSDSDDLSKLTEAMYKLSELNTKNKFIKNSVGYDLFVKKRYKINTNLSSWINTNKGKASQDLLSDNVLLNVLLSDYPVAKKFTQVELLFRIMPNFATEKAIGRKTIVEIAREAMEAAMQAELERKEGKEGREARIKEIEKVKPETKETLEAELKLAEIKATAAAVKIAKIKTTEIVIELEKVKTITNAMVTAITNAAVVAVNAVNLANGVKEEETETIKALEEKLTSARTNLTNAKNEASKARKTEIEKKETEIENKERTKANKEKREAEEDSIQKSILIEIAEKEVLDAEIAVLVKKLKATKEEKIVTAITKPVNLTEDNNALDPLKMKIEAAAVKTMRTLKCALQLQLEQDKVQKDIFDDINENFLKKFPMRYKVGIGAGATIGTLGALGLGYYLLSRPNTSAPSILERLRYKVFGGTMPTARKAGLVQLYLDTPPEKREELVRSYQRAYRDQDIQQIIDQAESELES